MLHTLSGGAGAAIIAAALLVTAMLEVIDQRAAPAGVGEVSGRRTGSARALRALRALLVVLVVAAIAATVVRIFVVVG